MIITAFKKYLFGIIVSAYVLSATGIPVYLHYCGGSLEKVNYVVKGESCCDGEDDDSSAASKDCCRDENLVIQNTQDFTLKQFAHYDLVKTFFDLFYVSLPYYSITELQTEYIATRGINFSPPKHHQHLLISTSVLRI